MNEGSDSSDSEILFSNMEFLMLQDIYLCMEASSSCVLSINQKSDLIPSSNITILCIIISLVHIPLDDYRWLDDLS